MKIMFAWELGSAPETLWNMGRLANALKAVVPGCKIALVCFSAIERSLVSWADKVYMSPKVAYKHETKSGGVAQQLHQLGWTTDELRGFYMQTWSAAFNKFKPDCTFSFEAPGATLVGTMMGYRILLATARLQDDYSLIQRDFPELGEWFVAFCGHSPDRLLNRPGISFLPAALDARRSSLVLNIAQFERVTSSGAGNPRSALIIPSKGIDVDMVVDQLQSYKIEAVVVDGEHELLSHEGSLASQIVIGAYSQLACTYALNQGVPFLGVPGDDPRSIELAAAMEQQRRGFRIDTDGVMVDVVLSDLLQFSERAKAQFEQDGGGICSAEEACEFFVGKKKPR